MPSFADGGLISGPTMAMVGEYPGARSNPEVIAPLSKLEGMLAGRGMQTVNVVGVIRGSDILLMSEKAAADRQRVRGG